MDRAAERRVERVAHARGAVVGEIVVAVLGVFRTRVPVQVIAQFRALRGSQIQVLFDDPTAFVAVDRKFVGRIIHIDPVQHAPAREVEEEILLCEIEHAVVVQAPRAAGAIADEDGIVAEALPHLRAGAEGDEGDIEIGARLRRWLRKRKKWKKQRNPEKKAT